MRRLPLWATLRLFVVSLYVAVAKLELVQAASRSPCRRLPEQRAERGVKPVEVPAPVCQEEAVGDSDLIDSQPGVALQVQRLSQVYLWPSAARRSTAG